MRKFKIIEGDNSQCFPKSMNAGVNLVASGIDSKLSPKANIPSHITAHRKMQREQL